MRAGTDLQHAAVVGDLAGVSGGQLRCGGYAPDMTQQQPPGTDTDIDTDITAADLDADIEVSPGDVPATSDPDAFTDDGLGMGDGPDINPPSVAGD